jgi:hypothetical protein
MIHSTKHDLTRPSDSFSPLLAQGKSNPDAKDFTSGMDFNSIVPNLKAKGMNTREIHNDFIVSLGTKVPSYSTVTR